MIRHPLFVSFDDAERPPRPPAWPGDPEFLPSRNFPGDVSGLYAAVALVPMPDHFRGRRWTLHRGMHQPPVNGLFRRAAALVAFSASSL